MAVRESDGCTIIYIDRECTSRLCGAHTGSPQLWYRNSFVIQSDAEASLRDARSTIAELERQMATLMSQKSEEPQTKESRNFHMIKETLPQGHKSHSYQKHVGISSAHKLLSGVYCI